MRLVAKKWACILRDARPDEIRAAHMQQLNGDVMGVCYIDEKKKKNSGVSGQYLTSDSVGGTLWLVKINGL